MLHKRKFLMTHQQHLHAWRGPLTWLIQPVGASLLSCACHCPLFLGVCQEYLAAVKVRPVTRADTKLDTECLLCQPSRMHLHCHW